MVTTQALANIFDHFDRTALIPYAVGFDRIFDQLQVTYLFRAQIQVLVLRPLIVLWLWT